MTALIIANTQIRQDVVGRYCLNDLHQASGGESRHRPGNWLMLEKTKELIAEVQNPSGIPGGVAGIPATGEPVVTLQGGLIQGTYAVKELVYAYAMWISAAFHLHVIRAYDALVMASIEEAAPTLLAGPQHRADQLVGAGRIFSAALRTARAMRMPPQRAMLAAFECARRNAGVDWLEELDAGDLLASAWGAAAGDIEFGKRIADWVEGRNDIGSREIIAGADLGDADDRALQMRVADVMRELGWRKVRPRYGGFQPSRWLWRRAFDS
ncbi:MAG: KilA-N domain-containing protein [Luteimonas sp.]